MSERLPVLAPPATRPHVSVARLSAYWYVACEARELRKAPIERVILGIPMVLFRGADGPAALVNRCSHRNVPMDEGKVVAGTLECPYHGWRYSGAGECVAVPGLCDEPRSKGRDAVAYPTREQDGMVWVWPDVDKAPDCEPPTIAGTGDPAYATVRAQMDFPGSIHAVAENALDVPHTAFLHGGLFRTAEKTNEITCKVRREENMAVCQYMGEPAPTGLIGRLLAPQGGIVEHYDRFILPSITEVEYKLGTAHVLATQALTPVGDFMTRMYAVLNFKLPYIPHWLVKLVVTPVAFRILRQDAVMLKKQTDNVLRFGGERYTSTDIDVLGPHIWHLLKMAERGESRASDRAEREVRMKT